MPKNTPHFAAISYPKTFNQDTILYKQAGIFFCIILYGCPSAIITTRPVPALALRRRSLPLVSPSLSKHVQWTVLALLVVLEAEQQISL
jgi:hypothetical protein